MVYKYLKTLYCILVVIYHKLYVSYQNSLYSIFQVMTMVYKYLTTFYCLLVVIYLKLNYNMYDTRHTSNSLDKRLLLSVENNFLSNCQTINVCKTFWENILGCIVLIVWCQLLEAFQIMSPLYRIFVIQNQDSICRMWDVGNTKTSLDVGCWPLMCYTF